MMWQERQNAVVFECSMCVEKPIPLVRRGNRNSAQKARIVPSRVGVRAGRAKSTVTRAMLSKKTSTVNVPGVIIAPHPQARDTALPPSSRRVSFLGGQRAEVANQPFDFVRFQAFFISGHLVLSLGEDFGELRVRHLLNLRGKKIMRPKFFPYLSVPPSVWSM